MTGAVNMSHMAVSKLLLLLLLYIYLILVYYTPGGGILVSPDLKSIYPNTLPRSAKCSMLLLLLLSLRAMRKLLNHQLLAANIRS